MPTDPDRVAALIREAAAEEILSRFSALDPADVAEKAPNDFVTVADLAMEKRLGRVLADLLPGSVVLGEEAFADNPRLADALVSPSPVWVIDPLDGTANFAAGVPLFAVIVALVMNGETRAGWIYDPVGRRMAMGSLGDGATMDGRKLTIARPNNLYHMTGSIYGRRFRESEAYRGLWARGRGRLGLVFNTRSVGQEYLARFWGRMHFGVYTRLNPWDHAAGCLLHQEAGGHVALFDGAPYRPTKSTPGMVVAPDRAVWEDIDRTLIQPVLSVAST
ncbi:MAG: inositol monophosphatase [Alphaproteobacteria bacterium]|nr:inositol monophosphatase [Alphaproteobacteria bacterium]